jgi:hypothetical protein
MIKTQKKKKKHNTPSSLPTHYWMDQNAKIRMREENTKWKYDLKAFINIKTEVL